MTQQLPLMLIMALSGHSAVVDVFLMGGQSNMAGISNTALDSTAADSNIAYYYDLDSSASWLTATSGGEFTTLGAATHPNGSPIWGSEITLGRALDAAGYNTAIVKYSYTGTSLAVEYSSPSSNTSGTGVAWDNMVATYTDALQDIVGRGDTPVIRGFFWSQGESDTDTSERAIDYEVNFAALINDLEAEFASTYDFSSIQYITAQTALNIGTDVANATIVREAQASVMESLPNGTLFDTEDFERRSNDILHFSATGYDQMGAAFAEAYLIPEPSSSLFCLLGGGSLFFLRKR